MNVPEFQQRYAKDYEIFIHSEMGKALIETLKTLRPQSNVNMQPHQMLYSSGGKEGFEECIAKMLALAIVRKAIVQPDVNYGVHKQAAEDSEAGKQVQ